MPLHHAARRCDFAVVQEVLLKVPDMANVPTRLDRSPEHWTPLQCCADTAAGNFDDHARVARVQLRNTRVSLPSEVVR
jgi:hypothetical protein